MRACYDLWQSGRRNERVEHGGIAAVEFPIRFLCRSAGRQSGRHTAYYLEVASVMPTENQYL